MVVGVRAEDLHAGRDADATIPVIVDRVEALGAHLIVYFNVDAPLAKSAGVAAALGAHLEEVTHLGRAGTEFCAAFAPRSAVRVGDRVAVRVDAERLHFLDPETEVALGC